MNYLNNDIGAGLFFTTLVNKSCLASDDETVTSAYFDTTSGDSCKVVIPISATLTSGKYLDTVVSLQQYDGTTTYSAVATLTCERLTGASGGSTVLSHRTIDLDLMGYKKYVRVLVAQTFESADTDTSRVGVGVVYNKKYNNA